jgi:hypothetical protein
MMFATFATQHRGRLGHQGADMTELASHGERLDALSRLIRLDQLLRQRVNPLVGFLHVTPIVC